jgi:hypothetical protein
MYKQNEDTAEENFQAQSFTNTSIMTSPAKSLGGLTGGPISKLGYCKHSEMIYKYPECSNLNSVSLAKLVYLSNSASPSSMGHGLSPRLVAANFTNTPSFRPPFFCAGKNSMRQNFISEFVANPTVSEQTSWFLKKLSVRTIFKWRDYSLSLSDHARLASKAFATKHSVNSITSLDYLKTYR